MTAEEFDELIQSVEIDDLHDYEFSDNVAHITLKKHSEYVDDVEVEYRVINPKLSDLEILQDKFDALFYKRESSTKEYRDDHYDWDSHYGI